VPKTVTEAGRDASRFVEKGTLLLTNSGVTLGVPKITLIGGCINDGSVALLEVDEPLKLYLLYFLRTQTEPLRRINQGAAQPNLNTTIVKKIPVPLPPSNEQARVIQSIETRLIVCEVANVSVATSLARSTRLRQSILKWAFEGRLVDQDPTDEPASRLLERIRADREAGAPSTPKRTGACRARRPRA
jgi:type I restriction enzyme S subunit